jgi:drug/metabolite transporter (DMT)-like permease
LLVYTATFASLMAQVFYIKGVEWLGANRAALFINLVPVFGTLLSVVLLGEKLQLFHVIALALALGGIAIAEKGRPKRVVSTKSAKRWRISRVRVS